MNNLPVCVCERDRECVSLVGQMHICMCVFMCVYLYDVCLNVWARDVCICLCVCVCVLSLHKAKFGLAPS